jgi:hypothetical protein
MKRLFATFLVTLASLSYGNLIPASLINDHFKDYSCAEKTLINEDLENIDRLTFRGLTASKTPFYLGTAGGPGALKSTTIETLIHEDPAFKNAAYIDPDPQSLRLMVNTYLTRSLSLYAISKADSFAKAQIDAYNYWRGGSNYIALTLLNKAFKGNFNIAHGTTATPPVMESIYKTLKAKNYTIHLVLCYAASDTRMQSIEHRSKTQANYQVTPEDAVQKGKWFPERFPIYFKYADTLRLYWTYDFSVGSKEVARIDGNEVTISNKDGYEAFVSQYKKERADAGNTWPTWEELLKIRGIEA